MNAPRDLPLHQENDARIPACAPAAGDASMLIWRTARRDDVEAMIGIYNESVAGGGHSPTLENGTVEEMKTILAYARHKGWPLWVMTTPDGAVVGWAHLRTISWAQAACRSTGDLWLYVAESWQGSGIAMRMIRNVFKECPRYGFDAVTCWILCSNRRSLSLVRACRLTRWGQLPRIVDYGGLHFDLEIWGCRFDDPVWVAHMDRVERRYASLERLRGARAASAARDAVAAASGRALASHADQ